MTLDAHSQVDTYMLKNFTLPEGQLPAFGIEKESLAAPVAIAGTAAVRCDVAAPTITGAKLRRNGLENVTLTGRQL
jgi:hypothetical protein